MMESRKFIMPLGAAARRGRWRPGRSAGGPMRPVGVLLGGPYIRQLESGITGKWLSNAQGDRTASCARRARENTKRTTTIFPACR